MYKRLKLLFMVLIAIPTIVLSDQKTLLPITERERPLSLPRKSWKLDFGLELKCLKNDNFVDGLFDIQIPYTPIGKRAELHYLLPSFKFYPIKNTITQDNVVKITGPNFAIMGGIKDLTFSENDEPNFKVYYGLGYQFKALAGKKSWVFSNALGLFDYQDYWDLKGALGMGFQISEKFCIISAISGFIIHFYDYDEFEMITLPVDFKFNFNQHHGLMLRTGFAYGSVAGEEDFLPGVLVGIQYSCHW